MHDFIKQHSGIYYLLWVSTTPNYFATRTWYKLGRCFKCYQYQKLITSLPMAVPLSSNRCASFKCSTEKPFSVVFNVD
jgi:hypothetical protein